MILHGVKLKKRDLKHLKKTEKWGKKYGYTLNELTNFGKTISER